VLQPNLAPSLHSGPGHWREKFLRYVDKDWPELHRYPSDSKINVVAKTELRAAFAEIGKEIDESGFTILVGRSSAKLANPEALITVHAARLQRFMRHATVAKYELVHFTRSSRCAPPKVRFCDMGPSSKIPQACNLMHALLAQAPGSKVTILVVSTSRLGLNWRGLLHFAVSYRHRISRSSPKKARDMPMAKAFGLIPIPPNTWSSVLRMRLEMNRERDSKILQETFANPVARKEDHPQCRSCPPKLLNDSTSNDMSHLQGRIRSSSFSYAYEESSRLYSLPR
jgi:hypothetical protein